MGISLGGLSSGLDTGNMITQLVALERQPITKLEREEKVYNARSNRYGDVKTRLEALRSAIQSLRDVSAFQETQTVTSSDDKLLGAVRTAGAAAGGYTFLVNSLARAQQKAASASWTGPAANDTLRIGVGTPVTTTTNTPASVTSSDPGVLSATRSGAGVAGSYAVNVTSLAQGEIKQASASFTGATSSDSLRIGTGPLVGSEPANTVQVDIDMGDDLDTIATKINNTSGIAVTAAVVNGRLELTGPTGAGQDIHVASAGAGTLAADMGLTVSRVAADAAYTVDGGPVQTSSTNSIANIIAGTDATLLSLGSSTLTTTEASSSSVTEPAGTVEVALAANDNLASVASKINGTAGIGVYASVVEGRLYLSSRKTGADNEIHLSSQGSTATDMGMSLIQSGANASYTFNGTTYTDSASNTVANRLPGVSLTLKSTGTATINVSEAKTDSEALAKKMESFVNTYNDVMKEIDKLTKERPLKRSQVTSDAQRVVGALFNDTTLTMLGSHLRTAADRMMGAPQHGDFNQLSEVGVKKAVANRTISDDAKSGALTFDKAAFIAAYEKDPNSVKSLLTKVTDNEGTEGMAQYLERKVIRPYLSGSTNADGTTSPGMLSTVIETQTKQIEDINARQARMETRVSAYEKRLSAQFATLENNLARMNSMRAGVAAQMAGMM